MSPKDKPILTADFVVRKDSIPQQVKPPVDAGPAPRVVTSMRLKVEDNEWLREIGHSLRMTKTELIDEAIALLRERHK
jgi:hypothetical protein